MKFTDIHGLSDCLPSTIDNTGRGSICKNLYGSSVFIRSCILLVPIFILLGLSGSAGFAELKDVNFENQHSLRINVRGDDDDYHLYLTRVQACLDYNLAYPVRIAPFLEYQHNLKDNAWWRRELGAEIGAFFFNDCLYLGASFQHVWQQEENYTVESLEETSEWESRLVITPPLQWGIFGDKVKLRIFDEYTYDFTRGQATVNEVGAVVEWQLREGLRLPIGWRHVDRVHDFDNDMLELSVLLSF